MNENVYFEQLNDYYSNDKDDTDDGWLSKIGRYMYYGFNSILYYIIISCYFYWCTFVFGI